MNDDKEKLIDELLRAIHRDRRNERIAIYLLIAVALFLLVRAFV